jgi:phosphoglycerol transferase MdoB-like AlkP superfamily enzyme
MKAVKAIIRYFLFYTLFFVICRIAFFLINIQGQKDISIQDLFQATWHGGAMDLSLAGYITVLLALILITGEVFKWKGIVKVINVLNIVLISALAVFVIINARLYSYWGYHIDASILDYLRTPKEALASANAFDWLLVLCFSCILIFIGVLIYRRIAAINSNNHKLQRSHILIYLLLLGVLFIPIRGGFGVATMNVSRAYFSNRPFVNHLAVNPVWNAAFSLSENKNASYHFIEDQLADDTYNQLYVSSGNESLPILSPNTNVIFIVLESFTANVVSSIGGIDGLTPELNKWMNTGLSYEQCYASGDRSDKGLATLYTGFPALPNARLLSYPNKLAKVPHVYKAFKDKGYLTSFYYGGNLDFANIKLLFSDGSVDHIVTGNEVDSDQKGKWGIRDSKMFEAFFDDVTQQEQPFFSSLYTLSSHEPFDIPKVSYKSDSLKSDFYKAIFYTDSCFGAFMTKLQKTALWENTVVVVTADHGVKNPGNLVMLSPRKFRVPLLITGGAIKDVKRYSQYCSHTDVPYSMEHLIFGSSHTDYPFSKSIFDTSASHAFYYYVLGAGLINENGCVVYDIKAEKFLVNQTQDDSIHKVMRTQILGVTQKASRLFDGY